MNPTNQTQGDTKPAKDKNSSLGTKVSSKSALSPVTSQSSDHSRKLRGYLEVKHNPLSLRKTRNRLLKKVSEAHVSSNFAQVFQSPGCNPN